MLVNFNVVCHNKDLPLFNLLAILIIRYIYVFFNTKIQIFFLFYRDFTRKAQKKQKSEIKFKIPIDKGREVWYYYGVLY